MTLRRALVVALLATSLQLAAAKITKVGRSHAEFGTASNSSAARLGHAYSTGDV